jgi:hypothetical protein
MVSPSLEGRLQIEQAIDDRDDDMVVSQRSGSVVAAPSSLQAIKSVDRDRAIVGLKVVAPDEAMREFKQS